MARFYREDVWPVVIAILVIAGLLVWGYIALVPPASAAVPEFDHSNCQYPERLSNPPDGCDNSDPARPECMKFGTEECDLPYADGSLPTKSDNVAPAASQSETAPKAVNCSEK